MTPLFISTISKQALTKSPIFNAGCLNISIIVLKVKSLCLSLNSDIFLIYIGKKYLIDFWIKEGSTSLPHIGGAKHVLRSFNPSMKIWITLSSQVNLQISIHVWNKGNDLYKYLEGNGFSINSRKALTAASLIFQSSPIRAEYNLTPVQVNIPILNALLSLFISGLWILPPAFFALGTKYGSKSLSPWLYWSSSKNWSRFSCSFGRTYSSSNLFLFLDVSKELFLKTSLWIFLTSRGGSGAGSGITFFLLRASSLSFNLLSLSSNSLLLLSLSSISNLSLSLLSISNLLFNSSSFNKSSGVGSLNKIIFSYLEVSYMTSILSLLAQRISLFFLNLIHVSKSSLLLANANSLSIFNISFPKKNACLISFFIFLSIS